MGDHILVVNKPHPAPNPSALYPRGILGGRGRVSGAEAPTSLRLGCGEVGWHWPRLRNHECDRGVGRGRRDKGVGGQLLWGMAGSMDVDQMNVLHPNEGSCRYKPLGAVQRISLQRGTKGENGAWRPTIPLETEATEMVPAVSSMREGCPLRGSE